MTFRSTLRAIVVAAAALTILTVVLDWRYTPRAGFVRSFYTNGDFTASPASIEPAAEISLDFVTERTALPRRSFGVRWRGFCYLRAPRTVTFQVASNDEVLLEVDKNPVIRHDARSRLQVLRRSVPLAAGLHEIVISYRQVGSGMGVRVSSSLPGNRLHELTANSIFTRPVSSAEMLTASVMPGLITATAFLWLAAAALTVTRRLRAGSRHPVPERSMRAALTDRMFPIAAAALVVPIVLFLVGPLTVHTANRDEYVVPFTAILWPWIIVTIAASWAVLVALGALVALVSERLAHIWAAMLVACGFLLWAQGTVMVGELGPIYGEALDIQAHAGRIPYELAVWATVLVLAAAFAGRLSRIGAWLSIVFVGLQVIAAAVSMAMARGTFGDGGHAWTTPPQSMYALSRAKNVIHVVLDAYTSEFFAEALRDDPSFFNRTFDGFVYFADHLGAFPTTRASMPAMLTGETYRNRQPFQQFLARTLYRRSITTALAANGFEVRSITFQLGEHPKATSGSRPVIRYTIPTPYGTYDDYARFSAMQLFDLGAFRHAPQVLKRFVYDNDRWLWQRAMPADSLTGYASRRVRASSHAAFLTEMTGKLTVAVNAPVYQFVHVAIPHPPVALDADCRFVEPGATVSREAYAGQARCGIALVGGLLDRLRALGIYDESVVVVTSDHGWRMPRRDRSLSGVSTPAGSLEFVATTAMPLLLVKRRDASGPLRTSMAPTSITDVAATIADLADLAPGLFPGQSVLQIAEGAKRSRSFAFHSWRDADWRREYMNTLHVFAVDGVIHDPASWRFVTTIAEPKATPDPSGSARDGARVE